MLKKIIVVADIQWNESGVIEMEIPATENEYNKLDNPK